MSLGSFKNFINKTCLQIIYLVYMGYLVPKPFVLLNSNVSIKLIAGGNKGLVWFYDTSTIVGC